MNNATLTDYCETFIGYGRWQAPIWFVGIEEAGGNKDSDVTKHLEAWHKRGCKDLEDAPAFYPASGNNLWHASKPTLQPTWTQLIRMLLLAQGKSATPDAILDYQRSRLGAADGETCLLELFPLPSPNLASWKYDAWSDLPWLQSRTVYQQKVLNQRLALLLQRIDHYRPRVVIFYGDGQLQHWRRIMGNGNYPRPIPDKLISHQRGNIAFFVTKHPANPNPEFSATAYFTEIGEHFYREHGHLFRQPPATPGRTPQVPPIRPQPVVPLKDWSSAIGLFIINFGMLDLHVQDFLETALPPEEFLKFRDRHFRDRVERIQKHVGQLDYPADKRQEFQQFIRRLEPVRELRNHIAHGLLRIGLAADQKSLAMTLSLPRALGRPSAPNTQHLTYEELLAANMVLTTLLEEFQKLFGDWVTDVNIGF